MTATPPGPDETPAPQAPGSPDARRGFLLGLAAYLLWGAMPLYFPLLQPAGPVEIIAHRVVWSLVVCAVILLVTRTTGQLVRVLRDRRLLATLALAAVLVAVNWTVYVWAVLTDRVLDAALGYFVNPLLTVLLAVVVLHERLRPAQWVAVGLGAVAVVVLTAGLGTVPWVALTLAASFGLYSLVKNRVGPRVGAVPGLAAETLVLAPVALAYLAWLTARGESSFGQHGTGHALALASAGLVTAVPLLLFAAAARRVPLRVVGLLQYLTPVLQFLVGLLVFHEAMPTARWIGFALVWSALLVLVVDGVRGGRRSLRRA